VTLKPRTLKVIGTDTDRFATYDFLLTFYSNHGPILYRFRDIQRFQMKIKKIFPPPSILHPRWRGSPWICVPVRGVKKLEWWGYQADKGLDRMHECDRRTLGHSKDCAYA